MGETGNFRRLQLVVMKKQFFRLRYSLSREWYPENWIMILGIQEA